MRRRAPEDAFAILQEPAVAEIWRSGNRERKTGNTRVSLKLAAPTYNLG